MLLKSKYDLYFILLFYILSVNKNERTSPEIKTQSTFSNAPQKDDAASDDVADDTKKQICKGNGDCSKIVDVELAFPKREFVKMMNIVGILTERKDDGGEREGGEGIGREIFMFARYCVNGLLQYEIFTKLDSSKRFIFSI
jgi:hypothetical protein